MSLENSGQGMEFKHEFKNPKDERSLQTLHSTTSSPSSPISLGLDENIICTDHAHWSLPDVI